MLPVLALVSSVFAQDTNASQGFGLGIAVGDPTGISAIWRAERSAFELGVGWEIFNEQIDATLDYQINVAQVEPTPQIVLPFYVGIGASLGLGTNQGFDDDTFDPTIGVRVPVGIALLPTTVPIDVMLEAAPVLRVVPDLDFGVQGTLSAHYFF